MQNYQRRHEASQTIDIQVPQRPDAAFAGVLGIGEGETVTAFNSIADFQPRTGRLV